MNQADTAWMLVSTALVLLMTPALAFFYGGLVQSKNALNTMMMSFISLGFVSTAWAVLGVTGMTVSEVRGHGKQKGHTTVYRGQEYAVTLLPKMQVEVVIPDQLATDAINGVIEAGRTGQIGNGRLFVIPVTASYRIRTGEVDVS